ncbi:MAG: hypothetical protein KGJ45_11495 [Elusimicrobia bacterium]|nr:hypothetical protein [Elusimicrobiota bacterium]
MDLLNAIGAPVTQQNILFLEEWNGAEGNAPGSGLNINNPLNTTNAGPGSFAVNSVGVQDFPSLAEGVAVNAETIRPPAGWIDYYPAIRDALMSGNPFANITEAVKQELQTWGTGFGWLGAVTTQTGAGAGPAPSGGGGESSSPAGACDDIVISWPLTGKPWFSIPGTGWLRCGGWWKLLFTLGAALLIVLGGLLYFKQDMPAIPLPA